MAEQDTTDGLKSWHLFNQALASHNKDEDYIGHLSKQEVSKQYIQSHCSLRTYYMIDDHITTF